MTLRANFKCPRQRETKSVCGKKSLEKLNSHTQSWGGEIEEEVLDCETDENEWLNAMCALQLGGTLSVDEQIGVVYFFY